MSMIKALVETPIGSIGVTLEDGYLCELDPEPASTIRENAKLPARVREQLSAYFEDASHNIVLPLNLRGTTFQKRVWTALREIPFGSTVTYGALARTLGTGARAIGGGCRANPCPIVVPCHRVVAGTGLGGFAGSSGGPKLKLKEWLLRHEGALPPEPSPRSTRSI